MELHTGTVVAGITGDFFILIVYVLSKAGQILFSAFILLRINEVTALSFFSIFKGKSNISGSL